MAKVSISNIASGYNLSAINQAIQALVEELNDKVLYRDSPTGEPNAMQNDLDMNGNDILNVGAISVSDIMLDGVDITGVLAQAVADAEAAATAAEGTVATVEAFADDAETAYQNALTVSNTGLDSASSFFDFGLIIDPIVTFPTDYGSVV